MKKSDLMVLVLVLSGSFLAVSAFLLPDLFSQNEEIKILDIQNVGPDKEETNQKKNDDLISKVEKGDGGRAKLTDDQISEHLEFWIGKWEGYDKPSNEIGDKFESKWKEKGKSLAFVGIAFEDGEQKDTYKGSIHYNRELNVFVDTLTYKKSGVTYKRHSVLDPESGVRNGFPVEPEPPEDIEVKFKWKVINRNNVDYSFKVLRGNETLNYKEFSVKRQIEKF